MNHNIRHMLLATASVALLVFPLAACGKRNVRASTVEAVGSQAERVAAITKQLGKSAPLPSTILDARFLEEKTGDGGLGPSDYKSFYALKIAPSDLPAWKTALSKSKTWNQFSNDDEIRRAAPSKAQSWWVSAEDVGKLEFFSPHSLTGSANGWVGIAPDGRIFIHVFTM